MDPLGAALFSRARFAARFGALGFVLGGIGLLVAVLLGDSVRFASANVFALGALAFALGLLGWSGSVFAGAAIENMNERLDSNSDWTEDDSRRAMTVIGSVGAGWMVGVSVMTLVLRTAY
ncbi:hypothetical protein ACFFQF_07530 [Haladaptatus pallidirubidus]|uniref:Uncharacterized protein n=1 Tax=Haladaptatus pallidirubidus TaxID=1008152 RepID=A0AAV3UMN0_9EURY|nr:hypothetical protein [Haladaptatus pallidirubidus]